MKNFCITRHIEVTAIVQTEGFDQAADIAGTISSILMEHKDDLLKGEREGETMLIDFDACSLEYGSDIIELDSAGNPA